MSVVSILVGLIALLADFFLRMMWFGGGKMEMVPLAATRFLEMMSEATVGWLLLEQAERPGGRAAP